MSPNSGIDSDAFRQFERAAHDSIAESYHRFFSPLTSLAIEPLMAAAGVTPGKRVLEVAAGSGALAAAAMARGAARVLATDISPKMIALAREIHPAIEFLVADAEELPADDASFDAVICNFGLGHFPDPHRAIAECVRVSSSGGRVALSWWDKPERQRFQGLFLDAIAAVGAEPPADLPAGPPIFYYSDDGHFAQLLRSVGLSNVNVATYDGIHQVESVEALWKAGLGSLARTGAAIQRQSPEVQHAIKSELARLAKPLLGKGTLRIPVSFKIGVGSVPN